MIKVLEDDPQFLREIEAFARGLAMYAKDEDLWGAFNDNWDCYIWWDTDENTYHACVYPVIGGEIDMSQSMSLNLGKYIGNERRKRIAEVDIVEVWSGEFEFLTAFKNDTPYQLCLVESIRAKEPVPRHMLAGYIDRIEEEGFEWVVPSEFQGEVLWKR
jgi:hypothetical protein